MDVQTRVGAFVAFLMVIAACGEEATGFRTATTVGRAGDTLTPGVTSVVHAQPDPYRCDGSLSGDGRSGDPEVRFVEGPGDEKWNVPSRVDDRVFTRLRAFTRFTVRWDARGVPGFRLDVSRTGGATWEPLDEESEDLDSETCAYTFTVPAKWISPDRPVLMRVASVLEPEKTHAVRGAQFLVESARPIAISEIRSGAGPDDPRTDIGRTAFVELVNVSGLPVDMRGARLHPNPAPTKIEQWWPFPDFILPVGGVVVVWSGDEDPPPMPGNVVFFRAPSEVVMQADHRYTDTMGNRSIRRLSATIWAVTLGGDSSVWLDAGDSELYAGGVGQGGRRALDWAGDPTTSAGLWPLGGGEPSSFGARLSQSPGYRNDGRPWGSPSRSTAKPFVLVPTGEALPAVLDWYAGGNQTCWWTPPYRCPPSLGASHTFAVDGGKGAISAEIEDIQAPSGVAVSVSVTGSREITLKTAGTGNWVPANGVAISATLRITDSAEFPTRVRVPVSVVVMPTYGYDEATGRVTSAGWDGIATRGLPDASVGSLYEGRVRLSYADADTHWRVVGVLPEGLRADMDGASLVISGAPAKPGVFSFTVEVTRPNWGARTPADDSDWIPPHVTEAREMSITVS